jgi:hypothetical protein
MTVKMFQKYCTSTWPPFPAYVHFMGQLFHTRCGGCSWEVEVLRDRLKMSRSERDKGVETFVMLSYERGIPNIMMSQTLNIASMNMCSAG